MGIRSVLFRLHPPGCTGGYTFQEASPEISLGAHFQLGTQALAGRMLTNCEYLWRCLAQFSLMKS